MSTTSKDVDGATNAGAYASTMEAVVSGDTGGNETSTDTHPQSRSSSFAPLPMMETSTNSSKLNHDNNNPSSFLGSDSDLPEPKLGKVKERTENSRSPSRTTLSFTKPRPRQSEHDVGRRIPTHQPLIGSVPIKNARSGSTSTLGPRMKKLPSLQEIGKVFSVAGHGTSSLSGSASSADGAQGKGHIGSDKVRLSSDTNRNSYQPDPKPHLHRLITSTPNSSSKTEDLIKSLSPYTSPITAHPSSHPDLAGPSSSSSPSTRLRLPLSALTRVSGAGLISSTSTGTTVGSLSTPMLITPGDEERQREGEVEGRKGEVVRGSESGPTGSLDAYGDDGAVGGPAVVAELGMRRRKSRWGPMLGSTRDVQSGVKDGRQDNVAVGDKPLPLQHKWTLYYDPGKPLTEQDKVDCLSSTTLSMLSHSHTAPTRTKNHIEREFEERLLILGEFDTVQGFGKTFGQTFDMKRNHPSKMGSGHNLHLFKDGIRPMYEDPANAQGGRWTLILHNIPGLLDRVWQNLVCALIGETIDPEDEICGAVISIRPRVERIQVWVRNKDSWDKVEQIGHGLLQGLDIDGPNIVMSLEFAGNTGQIASPRPHLAIGKGVKHGPKLAPPRGPPGIPLPRPAAYTGSAPNSRRNSPTQSGIVNPFAGPLGIAQQPISPRPSSLRPPSASVSHNDNE